MDISYFSGAKKLSKLKSPRQIKYLVFHYTAGTSSKKGTAYNVCSMWNNSSTQASADAVVDDFGTWIYNAAPEKSFSWAVGGSRYSTRGGSLYGSAKNSNSYSVELCSSNSARKITTPNDSYWSFTDAVLNNAVEFGAYIMNKYNIPIDRVIRHYDVTGKLPLPVDSTQLLTSSGWKPLRDIDVGDIVMTYNKDSDSLDFDSVSDKLSPWIDTVYKCAGFEATYDHRTLYFENDGVLETASWGKIFDSDEPLALKTNSCYCGVGFTQNVEHELKQKSYSWELLEISRAQLEKICQIVFKNDFVIKGDHNLDVINAVMATHGINIAIKEKVGGLIHHFIHPDEREYTISRIDSVEKCNYENGVSERKTEVSCVTVPSGYILVKQGDNIYITGNCPGIKGWNDDSGSNASWLAFKKRLEVAAKGTSTVSKTDSKTTTATTTVVTKEEQKKEDELDMTVDEFIKNISNDQSAMIGSKYRASLNSDTSPSSWAKESWEKAINAGVIDGSRPHDIMTREEFITVLNRVGALK